MDRIPTNGLPLLWERRLGTGYSAPSVAGGVVVYFHRDGREEQVEAAEAATGRVRWTYAYPSAYTDPYGYNNGPRCTPLIARGRVYLFGAEGTLTCLNFADGKLIWQRRTAEEFEIPQAFFGVGSTPVLEGDKLLVMIGGQPDAAPGASHQGAFAVEAQGGKFRQGHWGVPLGVACLSRGARRVATYCRCIVTGRLC